MRCAAAKDFFPNSQSLLSRAIRAVGRESQTLINAFVERLGRIWALGGTGFYPLKGTGQAAESLWIVGPRTRVLLGSFHASPGCIVDHLP